jgi:hypothetical protein
VIFSDKNFFTSDLKKKLQVKKFYRTGFFGGGVGGWVGKKAVPR